MVSEDRDHAEALSPLRAVEGVNTAPMVSAEQELAGLRAEVARLQQHQLALGLGDGGKRPDAAVKPDEEWADSGLKIDYGERQIGLHSETMKIMQERFKEGSICPSSDFPYLPQPSTDMATLEHDFVRWGYCIVGDAMAGPQIERVVSRMIDQAAAERAAGVAKMSHFGNAQLIFNALPKGREFRDLIAFEPTACTRGPIIEELLGKILGSGWYLGTCHGSIVHEGGGIQGMHQDQGQVLLDGHSSVPLACLILWTFSEFSLENGGTYLVPGSHRYPSGAPRVTAANTDYMQLFAPGAEPGLVGLSAPAGACILTDSRLLHSGGERTAPGTRYGMRNLYIRGFMRCAHSLYPSSPPHYYCVSSLSPARLQCGHCLLCLRSSLPRLALLVPLTVSKKTSSSLCQMRLSISARRSCGP